MLSGEFILLELGNISVWLSILHKAGIGQVHVFISLHRWPWA